MEETEDCLAIEKIGTTPSFGTDLRSRLIEATLDELRSGRMGSSFNDPLELAHGSISFPIFS